MTILNLENQTICLDSTKSVANIGVSGTEPLRIHHKQTNTVPRSTAVNTSKKTHVGCFDDHVEVSYCYSVPPNTILQSVFPAGGTVTVTEEKAVCGEAEFESANDTKVVSTGLSLGSGDLPPSLISCAAVVVAGTSSRQVGNAPGFTVPSSAHNTLVPSTCTPGVTKGHESGTGPSDEVQKIGSTQKTTVRAGTAGATAAGVTSKDTPRVLPFTVTGQGDLVQISQDTSDGTTFGTSGTVVPRSHHRSSLKKTNLTASTSRITAAGTTGVHPGASVQHA